MGKKLEDSRDFIDNPTSYDFNKDEELTYLRECIAIKTHEYQEREKSFEKKFNDGILKAEAVTGLMDQLIIITNENHQLRTEIAELNGRIHKLENTVVDYSVPNGVLKSLEDVFRVGKGDDDRFRFSRDGLAVDIDDADVANLIGELQGMLDE